MAQHYIESHEDASNMRLYYKYLASVAPKEPEDREKGIEKKLMSKMSPCPSPLQANFNFGLVGAHGQESISWHYDQNRFSRRHHDYR